MRPGDRIENEVDLAQRLGLSRPTVARAVNELVAKGLLVRRRGVGTEVANPNFSRRIGLTSLHADLLNCGRQVRTNLLRHDWVVDPVRAERLGAPAKADLLFIERVRLADAEPLAVMRNWLPAERATFKTSDLETCGLYDLLAAQGVTVSQAEQHITARLVTPHEAELLRVRRGSAALTLVRLARDTYGAAIELGEHTYRGDAYTLDLSVDAP
ncbi:GntR family transcriptional regulator [Micrococcales bacterium 31B]|nr:GntR family transcriptional regulator [Micrococcales bacterium 31B]